MESKKIEENPKTTPTRALCNLMETIETQSKRINVVEQQFLSLSARITDMEGPNPRARPFR